MTMSQESVAAPMSSPTSSETTPGTEYRSASIAAFIVSRFSAFGTPSASSFSRQTTMCLIIRTPPARHSHPGRVLPQRIKLRLAHAEHPPAHEPSGCAHARGLHVRGRVARRVVHGIVTPFQPGRRDADTLELLVVAPPRLAEVLEVRQRLSDEGRL